MLTQGPLVPLPLLLVWLFVACAPAIDVHTITFAKVNVAQYRTFSFGPPGNAPSDYQGSPMATEVQARVRLFVRGYLRERGFSETPNTGDVIVQISSGRRERTQVRSMPLPHPRPEGPAWFVEHEEEDFVEGVLVIDFLDGQTREPVWHGAARVEIQPDRIDDRLLKRATDEVLAASPWSGTGGTGR